MVCCFVCMFIFRCAISQVLHVYCEEDLNKTFPCLCPCLYPPFWQIGCHGCSKSLYQKLFKYNINRVSHKDFSNANSTVWSASNINMEGKEVNKIKLLKCFEYLYQCSVDVKVQVSFTIAAIWSVHGPNICKSWGWALMTTKTSRVFWKK